MAEFEPAKPEAAPNAGPAAFAVRVWKVVFFSVIGLVALSLFLGSQRIIPGGAAFAISGGLIVWAISTCIPYVRIVTALPVMVAIAPIVAYRQRMRFPGRVEEVASLPPELPESVVAQVEEYRRGFVRLGFRSQGIVKSSGLFGTDAGESSTAAFMECFWNAGQQGAVMVFTATGLRARASARFFHVLPTDMVVAVLDSDIPGLVPSRKSDRGLRLGQGATVAELFAVFQGLMHRFAPGVRQSVPANQTTRDAVLAEHLWTEQHWQRQGWMVPSGVPGELRLTKWRACAAGWGALSPFHHLVKARNRRRSARNRRAWGV